MNDSTSHSTLGASRQTTNALQSSCSPRSEQNLEMAHNLANKYSDSILSSHSDEEPVQENTSKIGQRLLELKRTDLPDEYDWLEDECEFKAEKNSSGDSKATTYTAGVDESELDDKVALGQTTEDNKSLELTNREMEKGIEAMEVEIQLMAAESKKMQLDLMFNASECNASSTDRAELNEEDLKDQSPGTCGKSEELWLKAEDIRETAEKLLQNIKDD